MSASENVPNIVLNAYLECPVCLDFAASPIHTCKNGHIVCGICEEKTKICPTCRADNLSVCDFLERVLKAEGVVVPCRNSQHGCTLLVPPSEMKTHLADSCDFRPIKCREGGELCDQKPYHPKELFKHWVNIHDITPTNLILPSNCTSVQKGLLGTASEVLTLMEQQYKSDCRADAERSGWTTGYVEIDGRTFILHYYTEGGNFTAGMTLLGIESDANKYGFVATLSSKETNLEKRIIFPRIPVHSLQHYSRKKIDDLGHTASVRVQNLKLIQGEKPSDPENYLEWRIRFDIFSVESLTKMELE